MKNYLTGIVALAAISISAIACEEAGTAPGVDPVVTIQGSAITLDAIGRTNKISIAGNDERGAALDTLKLTWSVDNPNVAKVSSTGVVTAVGEGDATLTVQYLTLAKATAPIRVRAAFPFSVSLSAIGNPVADSTLLSSSAVITVHAK